MSQTYSKYWRVGIVITIISFLIACGGSGASGGNSSALELNISEYIPRSDSAISISLSEIDGQRYITGEIQIVYNDQKLAADYVRQQNWRIVGSIPSGKYLVVQTGAMSEADLNSILNNLVKHEFIKAARFNYVHAGRQGITSDPVWSEYSDSWNLRAIKLDEALNYVSKPGLGVSIGVIDSEFSLDHSDLNFDSVQKYVKPPEFKYVEDNYYIAGVRGGIFGDVKDAPSHGMHVAGIIAAKSNSYGAVGVAPFAKISGYDPFVRDERDRNLVTSESLFLYAGTYAESGFQDALYSLVEEKQNQIINISMNRSSCTIDTISDNVCRYGSQDIYVGDVFELDLFYAMLKKSKIPGGPLFVQGAGNLGEVLTRDGKVIYADHGGFLATILAGTYSDPEDSRKQAAIARNTIVVGAYGVDKNGLKTLAPYTQVPSQSGQIGRIESSEYYKGESGLLRDAYILAPGGNDAYPVYSTFLPGIFNQDRYGYMKGTSQATPHVTGVAALVWQANPNLTAAQVREIILSNSDTVDGYRALNSEKAVRAALGLGCGSITSPSVVGQQGPLYSVFSNQSVGITAISVPKTGFPFASYQWTSSENAGGFTTTSNPATSLVFTKTGVASITVRPVLGDGTVCPGATSQITVGAAPSARLIDTGITASQCYQAGSNVLVSCTSPGALALNNQQDGMVGRDVTVASSGDGRLGFSYSKVGGYALTECVKDNVTGLIWEGKTATGARGSGNQYTNFHSSYLGTQAQMDAATNTYGYVAAVNATALCGYTDWRLPTVDELLSLVNYGVPSPGPTIDNFWFLYPVGGVFASSSPVAGDFQSAWGVSFREGYVIDFGRGIPGRTEIRNVFVRLVRDGQ